MKYTLRMTEEQHRLLASHLFPGDGLEAVALLLCGRRSGEACHAFIVRTVVPVPYEVCDRRSDRITWPTYFVDDLIREAYGRRMAILKIHGHPPDYTIFSKTDDISDHLLFSAVSSLLDDGLPHGSLLMMPNGEIFGRVLDDSGQAFEEIGSTIVVGEDLRYWHNSMSHSVPGYALRHAQAFGKGTTSILGNLSAAVVGCSGTGSIVAEQLARLGIGRLVLVDPDVVEEKNLNRILNAGKEDAYLHRPKVEVLARAIARMGLGQEVIPIRANLIEVPAMKKVAECDVAFGCTDGVEGRHWLNRLATFYILAYFDVGVRLDADGNGGIDQITGAVHYLQPGKSSLFSRGVYDMSRLDSEAMSRTNPEMFRQQVDEGYLRGVNEDRPAVISVNMFFAALAVNEFLARLHTYRNRDNQHYAYVGGNLSEMQVFPESEGSPCGLLGKHVGRGDMVPFLDRPL